MDLDKITATASPSPNRWSDKVPSREMTREEIHEFVEAFDKVGETFCRMRELTEWKYMRYMKDIFLISLH